jgi:hypothetical protein
VLVKARSVSKGISNHPQNAPTTSAELAKATVGVFIRLGFMHAFMPRQ